MVRVNDTRYFHDFETDHVLREFTNKECGIKEIKLPYTVFGDPNLLSPHMPLRTAYYHKITWPSSSVDEKSVESQCGVSAEAIDTNDVNSQGDV